ncbi:hypothetical protein H4R18_004581 [Coemansia javaensis]|uniref:catechol O-methyltransferase n=1 Tax=Coemansia javaensis TaxID=2761396 RepID=A0A9W8H8L4_9FUNG|nr:hypothetical protein H4R18_004581 [Coemansia javaensis]
MLRAARPHARALHAGRAPRALAPLLGPGSAAAAAAAYAARHSQPEPPELRRVRLAALAADPAGAQKMVSPLQGAFMAALVRAARPAAVLELGCYVGYSALWLAHGLCRGAAPRLWTCERDPDAAQAARSNIARAGLQDTVTVLAQPAAAVLEAWDPAAKLDLVFIDANKAAYRRYYDLVLDRDLLHPRGQIIVDNVLFRGEVLREDHAAPPAAAGASRIARKLHEFNQHVASDPRTTQVVLPVFDGLMLIQRADA